MISKNIFYIIIIPSIIRKIKAWWKESSGISTLSLKNYILRLNYIIYNIYLKILVHKIILCTSVRWTHFVPFSAVLVAFIQRHFYSFNVWISNKKHIYLTIWQMFGFYFFRVHWIGKIICFYLSSSSKINRRNNFYV